MRPSVNVHELLRVLAVVVGAAILFVAFVLLIAVDGAWCAPGPSCTRWVPALVGLLGFALILLAFLPRRR